MYKLLTGRSKYDIFYIRKGMRLPEPGVCNPSARVNKCSKKEECVGSLSECAVHTVHCALCQTQAMYYLLMIVNRLWLVMLKFNS